MRALFVTHSFPRFAGDVAGNFVLRLAVALRGVGVDVTVLAPSGPGLGARDEIAGIPIERFRYAPTSLETLAYTGTMAEQVAGSLRGKIALAGMLAGGARAVSRAVARLRPDVVHAHWWFPAGLITAFASSARPLVATFHGSDIRLAKTSGLVPSVFRAVMRRVSATTAVSQWLADGARGFAPDLRVDVAPMPVDTDVFPVAADPPSSRVMFVGRLNAQKGVSDLLTAVGMMGGTAGVDIVGDGPDRGMLEQLANAEGLAARISWHGQLPQTEIAPLYRAASAVAIPSRDEGLGLVAVEALLSGAAVVAYRSGGVAELVDHGTTGLLVEPGDVRAFADALDALVKDPSRARRMGAAGRTRMLSRFSASTAARAYADIYASVVQ